MIEHVPVPTIVSVDPATVQAAGVADVNATVRPEVALAKSGRGVAENVWLPGLVKSMLCASFAIVIVKDCEASGETPFEALIEPEYEPAAPGAPEISPVFASMVRPDGRPDALNEIGFVPFALTWNE